MATLATDMADMATMQRVQSGGSDLAFFCHSFCVYKQET